MNALMGTSSNSVGPYPVGLRSVNDSRCFSFSCQFLKVKFCFVSFARAFLQHDVGVPPGSDRLEAYTGVSMFASTFRMAPLDSEPLPLPLVLNPDEELGCDRCGFTRGVPFPVSDMP